jgi:hypothetical protein
MNLLVVVLLAGLWASILLPGALRTRRDASPMNSIDQFERRMEMLAPDRLAGRTLGQRPPSGRHVMVLDDAVAVTRAGTSAGTRARTLRRRRAMLVRLAAAVASTGLLAVVVGGPMNLLFAASFAVTGGYVAVLAQLRSREVDTRRVVRRLPVPPIADHDAHHDAWDASPHARAVGGTSNVRVRHWGG